MIENWFVSAQTAASPLLSRVTLPFGFQFEEREVLLFYNAEVAALSLTAKTVVWTSSWAPFLKSASNAHEIDYVPPGVPMSTYDGRSVFTSTACFQIRLV